MHLPGREMRLREPFEPCLPTILDALLHGLGTVLNRPYSFFGHSMGALVAFELARHIRRAGRPGPVRLFLAGYGAVHVYRPTSGMHLLPRAQLIDELRRTQGTPEAVLANEQLMDHYLPILRADLTLCAEYRYQPEEPLAAPISAFGGREDRAISHDVLSAWSELTESAFRLRMLPGNHFFPATARHLLLDAIHHDLLEDLGSAR